MVFYPRGSYQEKMEKAIIWNSFTTYEDMLKDLSDSIGQPHQKLSIMNFRGKVLESFVNKKVALVLMHNEEESSMSFRFFAGNKKRYGPYLDFYEIRHPPRHFLEQFDIHTLEGNPSLLALIPRIDEYLDDDMNDSNYLKFRDEFKYGAMKKFADYLIKRHAVLLHDLPQTFNQTMYSALCENQRKQHNKCFIFVLQKEHELLSETYEERQSIMKKIRIQRHDQANFIFVSYDSHPEVLSMFNVEESQFRNYQKEKGLKPFIVALNYDDNTYSKYTGSFNQWAGLSFVDRVLDDQEKKYPIRNRI